MDLEVVPTLLYMEDKRRVPCKLLCLCVVLNVRHNEAREAN